VAGAAEVSEEVAEAAGVLGVAEAVAVLGVAAEVAAASATEAAAEDLPEAAVAAVAAGVRPVVAKRS
jgi:hypothetical protein